MISRKFLKSSFIYTVIGALPLASSVILLPFYTNFLNTSDFGVLAIYISFTYLIQILINFGFDTYIGTHFFEYKDQKDKLREQVGTVVVTLLIIGLFFIVLSLLAGKVSFNMIFGEGKIDFFPFGFMSVLTAICNGFFKTYCGLLINQQRAERFFWVNIFNFVLTIAISLIGLYLYPYTLIGPMWGRLLSGVGIFILAFYFFSAEFGFSFQTKLLKGIFNFSFPVLIYFVMSWILSYIDRFIINYYLTTADVGVYDFAIKCTMLIDFILIGLTNSVIPKIFLIWTNEKINHSTPEVNRYYNAFTAITVLAIAFTILVVPVLVPFIVFKPAYYAAFAFLPLLSLSFIFRGAYTMYLMPVLFFKKTNILPKVFFISAIVQIIVSVLMIKEWGLIGVVWSVLITKPTQVFILYLESRKIFKFKFNAIKLFFLPVIFSAFVISIEYFLSGRMNPLLLHTVEMIIGCAMVVFIYRKELIELLKSYTLSYGRK